MHSFNTVCGSDAKYLVSLGIDAHILHIPTLDIILSPTIIFGSSIRKEQFFLAQRSKSKQF